MIDRIFYNTSTEEKNIAIISFQFSASNIRLRKCSSVLNFVKEWNTIAQESDHRYIDDSPSLNNKDEHIAENRHDQSIFSLLCKKNHHLVTKSMDFLINNRLNKTQNVVFRRQRNKT